LEGQNFPVFKNFYGGGLGSVRGFAQGSLGPRDYTQAVEGGASKYNFNLEILTPFPGAGNDRTIRMYGFFDMGAVLGQGASATENAWRSSVGIGISWLSPVGPLRIAYAKPIRTFAGDKIQAVQFQIGTSF
jgi:outer membrane protein insertion porin family